MIAWLSKYCHYTIVLHVPHQLIAMGSISHLEQTIKHKSLIA